MDQKKLLLNIKNNLQEYFNIQLVFQVPRTPYSNVYQILEFGVDYKLLLENNLCEDLRLMFLFDLFMKHRKR